MGVEATQNMLRTVLVFATLAAALALPTPQTSGDITISTFDGAAATSQEWRAVNDPVMGGQSTSTFHVDKKQMVGIFDGVTKIVPKLKAPGFCNMQTVGRTPLADISSKNAIELVIKSTMPYAGFKAASGPSPRSGFFAEYKADFPALKTSDEWQTVTIPFNHFSSKWSSYTGEPTTKCTDDKSVCPDSAHLSKLNSFEIASEGVAGKFHLEVKSIKTVTTSLAAEVAAAPTKDIVDLAVS